MRCNPTYNPTCPCNPASPVISALQLLLALMHVMQGAHHTTPHVCILYHVENLLHNKHQAVSLVMLL